VAKQEYARTVRNLTLFFQGKKSKLIKTLERDMVGYAQRLEFERAEETKRKIWALQHIQDVALIKRPMGEERGEGEATVRFEAYDIAHLGGTNTVGVLVAMEGGEFDKNSYRRFKLKGKSANKSDDTGNLLEVLERRFNHHEWPLPNAIIVDGSTAQINLARHVLETRGLVLPVIGVVKDERHRAREVVGDKALVAAHRADIIRLNAEAHRFAVGYHRALRSII
jgi:excinuclease ABC subunit C